MHGLGRVECYFNFNYGQYFIHVHVQLNGAYVVLIILINCLWLQGVEHASYKQLVDLIAHLSRKQEVLPCTLTLSTPIGAAADNAHQGGVEPEYVVPDRNN